VENGSYLRLRNLQIGYTFNLKGISRIRAYVQGTNLFTATKYSGLDPEILVNSNSAQGIDIGAYPIVSQYTFGLNIKF
jgi:hypothetical protein